MENVEEVKNDLSMKDFMDFFRERKLRVLSLPNGRNYEVGGNYITLKDLYKMIIGERGVLGRGIEIPIEDVIAVIAFGSAVRCPGTQKVTRTYRKYIFFGKKTTMTTTERIEPKDVDFLVIVNQDLTLQKQWHPRLGSYDNYIGSGIHVTVLGANQIIQGVKTGDTVSTSVLEEGIPIFFDDRLKDIIAETKIQKKTPRKIFWYKYQPTGRLYGKIG